MQIDALRWLTQHIIECNLYTGERCVKITMMRADYEVLVRDGFFVRDGKSADSAKVLNTTDEYHKIKYVEGRRQLA